VQDKRSFFLHSIAFYISKLQPSDTAYPRFKSRLSPLELERFYTLTDAERIFCDGATRSDTTRLGFALLLKTYQRLGYFVTSVQGEGIQLTPELLAAFSPYRTHHANRFGMYELRDRPSGQIDYGVTFKI
jgi:hypothetical protein